ncbi:hypothetical protein [Arthrobacter flavus]|uniref:Uncharacterized protein n=1 Tax=Arthrobacter flavus TaxID=95172 RepID=A0ABW4Q9F2_9MICC
MKQFSLKHNGSNLVVEFDQSALFWYRARLVVDNQVADERALFLGSARLRATQPDAVVVDARVGWFGPKSVVLAADGRQIPFSKD